MTKAEYRASIDAAVGELDLDHYRHQRKVYLVALVAGYRAGFTRTQMNYAREFLCSTWRMRRI